MTEGKRNLIQRLLQEYDIQSAEDIQEALKDLLSGAPQADFINRCSDRLYNQIGRCNLPYETLSEDRELLNTAYTIYQKIQDCNVAYNDTLDCVIDRIEEMIGEVQ